MVPSLHYALENPYGEIIISVDSYVGRLQQLYLILPHVYCYGVSLVLILKSVSNTFKILCRNIFRFLCSALYSVAWGIVSKPAATLIFLRHKIRMGPLGRSHSWIAGNYTYEPRPNMPFIGIYPESLVS